MPFEVFEQTGFYKKKAYYPISNTVVVAYALRSTFRVVISDETAGLNCSQGSLLRLVAKGDRGVFLRSFQHFYYPGV